MEEEEEIETKMSINKKQPTPSQTETTTNTSKVSPNSMNSSFKKISPFPLNLMQPYYSIVSPTFN